MASTRKLLRTNPTKIRLLPERTRQMQSNDSKANHNAGAVITMDIYAGHPRPHLSLAPQPQRPYDAGGKSVKYSPVRTPGRASSPQFVYYLLLAHG